MPILSIMNIDLGPGGLDRWSLSHYNHHLHVGQKLNTTVTPTGDVTIGNTSIANVSSVSGVFRGQGISGTGIPTGAIVTGIGTTSLTIDQAPTATNAGVTLTIGFPEMPFFILDPVSPETAQWLQDHQNWHDEINDRLGVAGNDLTDVNFDNQRELRVWLDLDFLEHTAWMEATGVT